MADNLSVKDASGATKVILMDEITVESILGLAQRVKILIGTADVSSSNPMPVNDAGGSLTTDTAQLPGTLGQKTMAGSVGVAIASDQSAVPVSGTVAVSGTTAVGGNVAHDAGDSGNPIKVGGKAVTAAPTAVANGDRVDAQYDATGRQAVFPGHGQSMPINDNGGAITVDGAVSITGTVDAEVGGDTANGSPDAGKPVKIGGRACASEPADENDGDRVNAQYDLKGRMAVFPGHGQSMPINDNGGSVTVDNAPLANAVDRQLPGSSLSTIRAKSGVTGRYSASAVDGHGVDPVLYAKDDAGSEVFINSASTAVTGSMAFGIFASTSTDVWYFIPMRNYRRLNFMVQNLLDRSLNVSIYGFLQRDGQADQVATKLLTTQSFTNPAYITVSSLAAGSGADVSHFAIPNLCEWDFIGIKCEVTGSAPTSGGVKLLVSRDVQ